MEDSSVSAAKPERNLISFRATCLLFSFRIYNFKRCKCVNVVHCPIFFNLSDNDKFFFV